MYWTDSTLGYIKSAKVDGSDVQLITSGLSPPMGIDIHDNELYFSEWKLGKVYKQPKSPGSTKILIHSDTSYMMSVKVYKGAGMYNVIKLGINTSVSSFQIKVLQIYYLTLLIQYYPAIACRIYNN
jgi:hypothetical protein